MRVGILGGGLQGSCIALALAERGVEVILFETTHCSAGPRSRTKGRSISVTCMPAIRRCVHSEGKEGKAEDSFDCVVNALWDGRRKLNDAAGFSNSSLTALSLSGQRARPLLRKRSSRNVWAALNSR